MWIDNNKNVLSCTPKDSLSYISYKGVNLTSRARIKSNISSQKDILEKERYIRRKGPVGFQTIEVKEDPNVSNRTSEIVKKLKEKLPNASIIDIWNHFNYSGHIRKGTLSGRQLPAKNVNRPNYYKTGNPLYVEYPSSNRSEDDKRGTLKTEAEIEGIRKACRMAREILDFASAKVVEGVFTDDIDRYIHRLCAIKSVYPATLNYHGFPKSVCTSVNEVACHGIPDSTVLSAGDLLKIDLSIYCDGYFGDVCETYMVMPMRKEVNKKFLNTNYMGRSERNKLIYRSLKHSNLEGCERQIVLQTGLIKLFGGALKLLNKDSGLFDVISLLFKHDLTKKFNFTLDEEMMRISKKLCEECRDVYEKPEEPYRGRVVGTVASEIPTYLSSDKFGKIFSTFEDPSIVFNMLDFHAEDRYNRPYTFSHSFEEDVELMKITHEALEKAISVCKPGAKIKSVGKTIEKFLESKKCKTISNLSGHGIGRNFHENPYVLHEYNDSDVVMEPGMVFTIEPIVTRSPLNSFMMWPDGWTLTTVDGSKTAQFEHTVLITKDGHEVLTRKIPSSPPYFWENTMEIAY
ncbi:methionine aminopeptidase [Theileria orientalis]|uniref:Methionine aminopeptidase n=1 Tax=Theileria orientalis TaxID=68886 RepID=A0A976QUP9_THEOR|nr:methionine aminopeptidase [Theileria orientalis]